MHESEGKISDYIDALNREQEPERRVGPADTPEMARLLATARAVRSLREPVLPDPGYEQRLSAALGRQSHRAWLTWPSVAALVAGFLLFVVLFNRTGLFGRDVVYAMEKAVARLSNYHAVMEMRSKNAAGEEWMVRRVELWSQGDQYAVQQGDGTLTVNNGQRKWQTRPQNKEVALLPLLPDPMRQGFDLRDEAKRAKQYPHTVMGTDTVAGRQATKLEIQPPGGLAYYLWIDVETNLPVQLQTAMQNAMQTIYTFVSFAPNTNMDPQIFTYQPPAGYRVIEQDPGQLVATVAEAAAISKVTPVLPQDDPNRIFAFQNRVVLDYGDTTVMETAVKGPFEPVTGSALGSAAGAPLEVWQDRLRWHQAGLEIRVEGARRETLARQIAKDLKLPDISTSLVDKAHVKVPVNMEIARADQQQVDGGHTPWQLDPLQVAMTFVNLQVSPGGIVGEPKIPFKSLKESANNGVECVVTVSDGPTKQVYLKRVIRQDPSGIWSVVGYDPR